MSRPKKAHAKAEYVNIGGFQPVRYFVCRCGWQTEKHYNRSHVEQQLREHIATASDPSSDPQEGDPE